jgi:transcriptional regulator with XRE-family HTH domain
MDVRTLRQLALAVRERRVALRLSQAQLAGRARVSRQWVSEFEAGKATAELGLALRLLDALDLRLQVTAADAERSDAGDSDAIDLDDLLDEHHRR